MQVTLPDYLGELPWQHRDKPKFAALINMLNDYFNDEAAVVEAIANGIDLDNATGRQLDFIGQWVGQPRAVAGIVTSTYFGFLIATGGSEGDASGVGFAAAAPFGEEGVPSSTAGLWYEEGSSAAATSALDDGTYRTLIRARIFRNAFRGNPDGLIAAIQTVLPGSVPVITDPGTRSVTIHVGRAMTAIESSLVSNLDILPRAAGVSYAVLP